MSNPFLGEVRLMSFSFPPKGWAACNGQILPISQNQALFSLLGTMYGGNGQVTFALPDLRGRVPLHIGNGFQQGQSGGEENHTLSVAEMPSHSHVPQCSTAAVNAGSPANNVWGQTAAAAYSNNVSGLVSMNPSAVGSTGQGQGHPNLSPYLTLNFCIALQGIFPSRN